MSSGIVTIQGVLPGTKSGTQYIGPYGLVPNVAGNFAITNLNLASGDNFFALPTWCQFTIIAPPVNNTTTIILKGASGDTGLQIDPSQVSELSWNTPPPSGFILNSATGQTSPTTIIFS